MATPLKKVLIVEDEAIIGMAMAAELEDAGYEVADVCPTGEEALTVLGRQAVDFVILDVKLGRGMDGLETISKIRSRGNPKIIVVSGNSDSITVQRIDALAIDGFFVKPLNTGKLLQHMASLG